MRALFGNADFTHSSSFTHPTLISPHHHFRPLQIHSFSTTLSHTTAQPNQRLSPIITTHRHLKHTKETGLSAFIGQGRSNKLCYQFDIKSCHLSIKTHPPALKRRSICQIIICRLKVIIVIIVGLAIRRRKFIGIVVRTATVTTTENLQHIN